MWLCTGGKGRWETEEKVKRKAQGCEGKAKGERRVGEKAQGRQRKGTAKQMGSKGRADGKGKQRDPEVT